MGASDVFGLTDHPRIRGEHDLDRPRTGRKTRIIPAYAGSTRLRAFADTRRRDHPRIRGEHSGQSQVAVGFDGSSPHTRGARVQHQPVKAQPRIIPAYAGSTRATARIWRAPRDHPRIRGEHGGGWAWLTIGGGGGSSPHTRGAQEVCGNYGAEYGIIPAYAGSTASCCAEMLFAVGSSPHTRGAPSCTRGAGCSSADHPRIRGEHAVAAVTVPAYSGSSPHTRGARAGLVVRGSGAGIIPAYAGSTYAYSVDHVAEMGSSPHTRGALGSLSAGHVLGRIIPAYAGSTVAEQCTHWVSSDHPRIRGEHLPRNRFRDDRHGSSPHTRGAHLQQPQSTRTGGIIPAYAGSTAMNVWKACFSPGSSPHTRGAPARLP